MTASVPERCPFCNSGNRREETWWDRPAYSFSCGTVFYANGEVALRYFSCYAREKERKEREIREQLAVARAEAERWRKKYEALKTGLEELIRHVRLVLPEVRVAQAPVSRRGVTPEDALRGGSGDE